MKISIKAKVFCQGEQCGHIGCVVINPITDQVTHIVVEDDKYPYKERIIPKEFVKNTTSDSIELSCSQEEFLKAEEFIEHWYVHVDKALGLYPARRHVYLPYGWPIKESFVDISHKRIPPGEITFHRGSKIEALDGTIGEVNEFLIDPGSGQITHLIMKKDRLWGKKEITIPVSEIDRVEEDTVYLNLDKEGIKALPEIPVQRNF
jgi:sporulation protein YlmC with PRC-barrel domain